MIEWGGWKYDEERSLLITPVRRSLGGIGGAVFVALLRAEGTIVSLDALGEAVKGRTRMVNARQAARVGVDVIRTTSKHYDKVVCHIGEGYRLLAIDDAPERRSKIEAILVDQFEATGPHARAVAQMIEELYPYG